ncbi:ABC transporter permease [Leucobacter sp.]
MTRRISQFLIALLLPLALLVWWWFGSASSGAFFFPPLSKILTRFRELFLSPAVMDTLVPSLINLAAGFLLAAVIGVFGGLILGQHPRIQAFFAPLIHFFRSLPGPALLPLFMLLFGLDMQMKVWVIAFTTLFPILLNTIDGVRAREPRWKDVDDVFRISQQRRFWHVTLPGAMPQIMTGLRVGLQTALLMMVVSEMLASTNGVGFLVLQSQQQFRVPDMWAGILMLGLLGLVLNLLFEPIERRVLRWYHATHDPASQ